VATVLLLAGAKGRANSAFKRVSQSRVLLSPHGQTLIASTSSYS